MPEETQAAVEWALQQTYTDDDGLSWPITRDTPHLLVDAVREYFNAHSVAYGTFSFDDLVPFLP